MNVSGLLRVASILLTAIVVVSFGLFVWDELGSASKHQSNLVGNANAQAASVRDEHGRLKVDENSSFRTQIDQANDSITSPGESIGKNIGDGNEWSMRTLAFIFGILVFLIGLRMLAAWIEMNGPAGKKGAQHNPQDGFTAGSR